MRWIHATCKHLRSGGAGYCQEVATMTIAGELVTEELEYDGGRQVTVYIPPDSLEAVPLMVAWAFAR